MIVTLHYVLLFTYDYVDTLVFVFQVVILFVFTWSMQTNLLTSLRRKQRKSRKTRSSFAGGFEPHTSSGVLSVRVA